MSHAAKTAREAMKLKAKRLVSADPHTKVDASSWTPPEAEEASVQTGMRPVSKRAYKKGGKVIGKAEGHKSAHRADRKPRKAGGRALTADSLINRDAKEANMERDGVKHVGGMKKGGRAHKLGGGPIGMNPIANQNQMLAQSIGMQRKHGGKTVHKKARGGPEGDFAARNEGSDEISQMANNLSSSEPMGTNYANVPLPPRRSTAPAIKARQSTDESPAGFKGNWTEPHKRGGKADGHKVEWLHHKKPHRSNGGKLYHVSWGPGAERQVVASHAQEAHDKAKQEILKRTPKLNDSKYSDTFKNNPSITNISGHAHGGKAGHPDEAEDKKLMHKMLKPKAFKAEGGSAMHHKDCSCKMCWGGKTEKNKGGGVFSGEGYPFKVPGEMKGGRSAHAHGGKAGKGKMNVNIIIGAHGHGQPGGASMPNAPVPAPISPRTPPMGGGMPVPPPGMMPPGGGAPGAGGPPMPPPGMMPRKSGGRTNYPIHDGSGGGEGRLEKIRAYGLKAAGRK